MDTIASSSQNNNLVDPLMEQMRSILRLGARASDSSQRRLRRFSDADRPSEDQRMSTEPMAIRSRDGTRWLPAPDEQSHSIGQQRMKTADDPNSSTVPILEDHHCNSAICAVNRVFETTELLELIISFLETKDVINLRRTSAQWNYTICQSPQLRLHFFTYGQWARPGSQFQLLPLSLPGLSIELGYEICRGRWIEITFTPEAAKRISPDPRPTRRVRSRSIFEGLRGGLGSKSQGSNDTWPRTATTVNSNVPYEELFVTQPPVLGMQAMLVYFDKDTQTACEDGGESSFVQPGPCLKLSCDAGITLGFLAETAQSVLNSQKAEPYPAKDVRVVFRTIMSFCGPEQAPKKRTRTRHVTPIQSSNIEGSVI